MPEDLSVKEEGKIEIKGSEVQYHSEKDFYRGQGGELRYKAEGLFKKAKEKGISIEDVDISILREASVEFPGIGPIDLPAFLVRITGKDIQSGRTIVDGKQMDYFNRYQKYLSEKIEKKNLERDEYGRVAREGGRPRRKETMELGVNDWELFDIGKSLIEDKEFGMEKTITGGCDRVIRKLMGENDWLSAGEARLLDEEFNEVQSRIAEGQDARKTDEKPVNPNKATPRQVNYLKARVKNLGMDPDNDAVMAEFIRSAGYGAKSLDTLTTADMSKLIDSVQMLAPKVKESLYPQ